MSGRQARMLRLFCRVTKRDYANAKRIWTRTPRNQRGKLREGLEMVLRRARA